MSIPKQQQHRWYSKTFDDIGKCIACGIEFTLENMDDLCSTADALVLAAYARALTDH